LSIVALIELDRIAEKAREGSKVAELADATLEMRRFEKEPLSLRQGRRSGRSRPLRPVAPMNFCNAMRSPSTAWLVPARRRHWLPICSAIPLPWPHMPRSPADEATAEAARALGNRVVTMGERLAHLERLSLNTALTAHQRNLLLSLAVVAALLMLTGILLARQVTRPLQAMETRMEAVASGQLTRLALDSPEREFVSLAAAFNHVLDELERRQHTLVRAEKLASLGTLLSGVAHELNNPLSNISSSAQILKEDIDADATFREQLIEDIDAETLRARRIVRTLLDYAGDREFKPAAVPLAELVEETLRFLKSKRPPGIEVQVEIAPALNVLGDRPRLQQVLLNLIVNAWDAIGEHGELRVSAQSSVVGKNDGFPSHAGQCRPGNAVIDLRLTDSGPGIPPELLSRVFDPFFTTKAVGHGSGLGLFIVFEIIEEHGGCISVANRPEGGAEFRIRLPAAPATNQSNP
jgi:two-component system NtrC family sensor kinase